MRDSVVEEASTAVVAHCETLLVNGTMIIDTYCQLRTLAGDAFEREEIAMEATTNGSRAGQKRNSHFGER